MKEGEPRFEEEAQTQEAISPEAKEKAMAEEIVKAEIKKGNLESKNFIGLDISDQDIRKISAEVLVTADFDTETKWPDAEKLPDGFNPEKLLEESRNPGLGIRELHNQGVDGNGIRVAIIDQKLLGKHREYKDAVVDYSEYGEAKDEGASMHGSAVASLLIGKTCGVAPGAELVYKATPSGRDFEHKAKALMDIVESNKTIEPSKKVRIVSCSIGYMEEKPEHGLDHWIQAIKNAREAGIIFVDTGDSAGMDFVGGGSLDKENFEGYDFAMFMKKKHETGWLPEGVVIPSDHRTMASCKGENEYMYNGEGGMSWSVPYLSGIFALALQINPELTQSELNKLVIETAVVNKNGLKIINPKGIIEAIKK